MKRGLIGNLGFAFKYFPAEGKGHKLRHGLLLVNGGSRVNVSETSIRCVFALNLAKREGKVQTCQNQNMQLPLQQ